MGAIWYRSQGHQFHLHGFVQTTGVTTFTDLRVSAFKSQIRTHACTKLHKVASYMYFSSIHTLINKMRSYFMNKNKMICSTCYIIQFKFLQNLLIKNDILKYHRKPANTINPNIWKGKRFFDLSNMKFI